MQQPLSHDEGTTASLAYLVYVFVVGSGLIAVYISLGFNQANLFLSVLGGSVVHALFRFTRHLWGSNIAGAASTLGRPRVSIKMLGGLALIYLWLCLVVLTWYGLGHGIQGLIA